MRHFNLLLLSGLAAIVSPLTACAQVDQAYQQMSDPMAVPPGMQAVAVTPRDLPANVDPAVAQAVQAQQQMQASAQAQPQMAQSAQQQIVPANAQPQATAANNAAMAPAAAPAEQAPVPAPAPAPQQSNNTVAALPIGISHGITFVTGGNNEPEIEQLKALDGEFNLQILFAAKSGEHLTNHAVRVLDYHNFELVSAKAVGPYLYLHINPGEYILEVTHEAGMKPASMKIKVPAKTRLRKTILLK